VYFFTKENFIEILNYEIIKSGIFLSLITKNIQKVIKINNVNKKSIRFNITTKFLMYIFPIIVINAYVENKYVVGINIIYILLMFEDILNELKEATQIIYNFSEKNIEDEKKILISNNDEIADLENAFNKLEEAEQRYITNIKNHEKILVEKAKLMSLGQLIGGIAHNLKTPIMSIAGASEGLYDLVKEYKLSIEDNEITVEDHKEIANEMNEWINKIKNYNGYMSDVINTVKNQAVNSNDSTHSSFKIKEVIAKIEILMNHSLRKYNCTLEKNIEVDENLEIIGEINNLLQIVNNLISNSIESYEGKKGKINLNISKNKKQIVIKVVDNGKGISKKVINKLFKEMITTKGKEGTGLGLFISNATIKAKFNGKMEVSSKENVGTQVCLKIPIMEA